MNTPAQQQHLTGLDSLRGAAAIMVALFHVEWPNYVTRNPVISHAYLMVDFFFVLSGFVIAYNYLSRISDTPSLGRFVWLRFWRLYPLHITMLAVFLAIEVLKYLGQHRYGIVANSGAFKTNDLRALILNAALAQGFYPAAAYTFNSASWSISLEFYTYVVFGLTIFTRRPVVAAVVLALAGLCVLLLSSEEIVARCLYGFFLGVLMFSLYRSLDQIQARPHSSLATCIAKHPRTRSAVTAILAVLLLAIEAFGQGLSEILLPPIAALMILAIALWPATTFVKYLSAPVLVWLGTLSYSIYMTHQAVLWLFDQAIRVWSSHLGGDRSIRGAIDPMTGTVLVVVFLVAILTISHFTYRFIESPSRDWSKIWIKKKAAQAS